MNLDILILTRYLKTTAAISYKGTQICQRPMHQIEASRIRKNVQGNHGYQRLRESFSPSQIKLVQAINRTRLDLSASTERFLASKIQVIKVRKIKEYIGICHADQETLSSRLILSQNNRICICYANSIIL